MRSRLMRRALQAAGLTGLAGTSFIFMSSDPRVSNFFQTQRQNFPFISQVLAAEPVLESSPTLTSPTAATPLSFLPASARVDTTPSRKWDNNWDLRDPEFMGKTECPKATRHLILIRHGQYHIENDDDKDRTLTQLGREQLQMTGQRLKAMTTDGKISYDKIHVSTMTRALESAAIIGAELMGVPAGTGDALLCEGAPYPPEPPHWPVSDKGKNASKLRYAFLDGPRIEAAFRKYFHRANYEQVNDSYEIIVCHANVIRYFAMRALQLPPEAWLRISLKNGSITTISITPTGKVALRTLGDAGHMPPDLLTTT